MNKQEIQSKIEVIKSLMSHLEEEITTLEFELEADEKLEKLDKFLEKPKLRHGDFGYNNQRPVIAITNQRGRLVMCRPTGAMDCQEANIHKTDFANSDVLGNVFDLMKDWDKDWEATWHSKDSQSGKGTSVTIDIDRAKTAIWFGSCGGSAWYAPDVIYEIWHALGHAIAELKQKKDREC